MKLLIVNDIAIEAQTMASDIDWKRYGIDAVFTAFNATEARGVIRSNYIDILLSDIEMPDEDGLSLIQWIRENEYDINCILLTCHADFEYARKGLSLGCQDYITLPAKYEAIGATVQKVCIRRKKHLEEKTLQSYGKNWLANQISAPPSDEADESSSHYTHAEISEKCKNYILDHIGDSTLGVNEVAGNVYLNPIYLNRIFKKENGISINQWIIKTRMELASALLLTTNKTAIDISCQIGYSNYPYFSTVFKKYYGMTPSQYVKENKPTAS